MGLYERITKERQEEKQRRGCPLGLYHRIDFFVLDCRAGNPPAGVDKVMICTGSTVTSTAAFALWVVAAASST